MKNEKKDTILAIILFSLVVFYVLFHVGRWYEGKRVQEAVYGAFEQSVVAEYVIVGGSFDGEVAVGRCLLPEGERALLEYYPEL